jgi:hypothetical protein
LPNHAVKKTKEKKYTRPIFPDTAEKNYDKTSKKIPALRTEIRTHNLRGKKQNAHWQSMFNTEINFVQNTVFCLLIASRLPLRAPSLVSPVSCCSLWRADPEADHSIPSNAKVKNEWSYASTNPCTF